jgi:hypothetical protein
MNNFLIFLPSLLCHSIHASRSYEQKQMNNSLFLTTGARVWKLDVHKIKKVMSVWLYVAYYKLLNHWIPTDGVSTLSWWWGLSSAETLRAMPAVV